MRAKEFIQEHRLVWKRNRKTGAISLKWRCESGPRTGRTVPRAMDCSAGPDLEKSKRMKITRKKTEKSQARRTRRAKKINPSSRLIQRLNKGAAAYSKKKSK